MVYNGSDQAGLNAPATGDTNMAGVIFPDGSLFGMWRGDRKQLNHSRPVYQYQYAVNASDWKDPSTYEWGYALKAYNIFPGLIHGPQDTSNCGIEDPHLWLDENEIVSAVLIWGGVDVTRFGREVVRSKLCRELISCGGIRIPLLRHHSIGRTIY